MMMLNPIAFAMLPIGGEAGGENKGNAMLRSNVKFLARAFGMAGVAGTLTAANITESTLAPFSDPIA